MVPHAFVDSWRMVVAVVAGLAEKNDTDKPPQRKEMRLTTKCVTNYRFITHSNLFRNTSKGYAGRWSVCN